MMPRKKRRRHSPELKAKVALEAIKGLKTAGELAAEYEVHPGQISQWKRQLLDEVPEIFERGYKNSEARAEQRESELYEQVGRLKMELEWLKKEASKLQI